MNPEPTVTKEPLADDLTPAEIQALIDERIGAGATSCQAVTENGEKLLVCHWPPL